MIWKKIRQVVRTAPSLSQSDPIDVGIVWRGGEWEKFAAEGPPATLIPHLFRGTAAVRSHEKNIENPQTRLDWSRIKVRVITRCRLDRGATQTFPGIKYIVINTGKKHNFQ